MIVIKVFIILIVGVALGYAWCYQVFSVYESQAETDLITLEEKFHSALERPHTFHIFNGQFEVYPLKGMDNRFNYKQGVKK